MIHFEYKLFNGYLNLLHCDNVTFDLDYCMNAEHKIQFATLSSTAFLMAAIAGFTDVISFIGANHLFTALITGNIVIAISEIIHHDPGVAPKILAIPLFIIFAVLITTVIEKHGKTSSLLVVWLLIEGILLGIFMYGGVYYFPYLAFDSWQYLALSMIAVGAL